MALRFNEGYALLILWVSTSLSDSPHSVGLLWTSNQLVAETFTWQHVKFTTDKHSSPRRDSNSTTSADELPQTAWLLTSM